MMDYAEWTGGQISSTYRDAYYLKRGNLADLAYKGQFDKALDLIEEESIANSWRLRTPEEYKSKPPTGWTTLHQAALLPSADLSHIERLISLGAYRNLRTLDTGETAYDIAIRSNRPRSIINALKPVYRRELDQETIKKLQKGVDEVVYDRVSKLMEENKMRTPPIEVLLELPSLHFWFPVPGFYGGFHIEMKEDNSLHLDSFCRVAGGSEQEHVVKPDGTWKLVKSGGW